MKQLLMGALLLTVIGFGCRKNNLINSDTSQSGVTAAPKPIATYQISNLADSGWILEGAVINFDNKSTNAVSYHWDFDNGTTSDDKIPSNISLAPCGRTYTITLTVKNQSGDSSTYSKTFTILCNGRHPYTGG